MRKLSKTVFVTLIGFLAVPSGSSTAYGGNPRDTNTSKVAKKSLPSMVRIAAPNNKNMGVVGSGIAIDARGYILTNHHVIDKVDHPFVGLYEKTDWYEAKVIFADKGHDLAVLKIDAKLPELPLGPSSDLEIGEPAIVIGNPYGQTFTVTLGIISKLQVPFEREDELKKKVKHYLIQTDAAINPGNSGGALLNATGEVVGVVEIKMGTTGLGWAITADRAQRVISDQMSAKKMAEVKHGVSGLELKVLSKNGKEAKRQGVFVTELVKDGPAKDLQKGDRILKVGDRVIVNQFDFERSFWDNKPGDTVSLTIIRNGEEKKVSITLTGDGVKPEPKD